jgi:uncharacterized membrane protein
MSQPPPIMKPDRLSAFTDGVIAIIITIMVLELPVPHGSNLAALKPELPLFGAYALSFVNVGIFWVNHHHMIHLAKRVDGRVLLANLFLLFWLSLVPFVIRWIGEAHISPMPVAAYGAILTMANLGYVLTERALIAAEPGRSALAEALGSKKKEIVSFLLYLVAVPMAFVSVWIAVAIYIFNALIWFVPDRRVERSLPDG